MADMNTLQKRINHQFDDTGLLELSLVHASRATPNRGSSSNERLEFLGDRVLGVIIAEMLYSCFPEEEEGALSRRFTALVRRETLHKVALNLDLGHFLSMSQSESYSGGRANPAILADACEALIGALFMDGGYIVARDFIETNWVPLLEDNAAPPKDAKTALQEWSQGNDLGLPVYSVLENTGPSHAPVFRIAVTVNGLTEQAAEGTSKRRAEQAAAAKMLEHIAVTDPRKFITGKV